MSRACMALSSPLFKIGLLQTNLLLTAFPDKYFYYKVLKLVSMLLKIKGTKFLWKWHFNTWEVFAKALRQFEISYEIWVFVKVPWEHFVSFLSRATFRMIMLWCWHESSVKVNKRNLCTSSYSGCSFWQSPINMQAVRYALSRLVSMPYSGRKVQVCTLQTVKYALCWL